MAVNKNLIGREISTRDDLNENYTAHSKYQKKYLRRKIINDIFKGVWNLKISHEKVPSAPSFESHQLQILTFKEAVIGNVETNERQTADSVEEIIERDEVIEETKQEKISYKFLKEVAHDPTIFPVSEGTPAIRKPTSSMKVILYVAEIINPECHSGIKCSKMKIGYIIRERMCSSHLSRITHLNPYANIFW